MRPPAARGPVTAALLDVLTVPPGGASGEGPHAQPGDASGRELDDALRRLQQGVAVATGALVGSATDVLTDEDLQLALFLLYELHYRGVDGVDDAWEWHPTLLGLRAELERVFEDAVRELVPVPDTPARSAAEVAEALFELTAADDGPSLSRYVAKKATDEQLREFIVHRSVYHLKEADPHSWALPRLTGRPKSALIEIQNDEYGGGRPGHIHAELFAATMRALGMDDDYGAYVDQVPAATLASMNLMSLFGLHRRLRGAITGHLAAFEMTSSIPCRRYSNGFRRLGYGSDVTFYFDEHVEADAVHEQIAGRDLAGALAELEPGVRDDVLWGAASYLAVDGLAGERMLAAWEQGTTALREATSRAA